MKINDTPFLKSTPSFYVENFETQPPPFIKRDGGGGERGGCSNYALVKSRK